jgi:ribosome-associated heat shock protein Hsp15
MRIDKWLWCARVFRTRSSATSACDAGDVTIQDQAVKPARDARIGEVIVVFDGRLRRVLRVLGHPAGRLSASALPQILSDETPPAERERLKATLAQRLLQRPKGAGRPTKRDRRAIDRFNDSLDPGEAGLDSE